MECYLLFYVTLFIKVSSGLKISSNKNSRLFCHDNLRKLPVRPILCFIFITLPQNKPILEDLKFGMGDGNLHYYIFNWVCPNIEPSQVGLVLQ